MDKEGWIELLDKVKCDRDTIAELAALLADRDAVIDKIVKRLQALEYARR